MLVPDSTCDDTCGQLKDLKDTYSRAEDGDEAERYSKYRFFQGEVVHTHLWFERARTLYLWHNHPIHPFTERVKDSWNVRANAYIVYTLLH